MLSVLGESTTLRPLNSLETTAYSSDLVSTVFSTNVGYSAYEHALLLIHLILRMYIFKGIHTDMQGVTNSILHSVEAVLAHRNIFTVMGLFIFKFFGIDIPTDFLNLVTYIPRVLDINIPGTEGDDYITIEGIGKNETTNSQVDQSITEANLNNDYSYSKIDVSHRYLTTRLQSITLCTLNSSERLLNDERLKLTLGAQYHKDVMRKLLNIYEGVQ